jgi:hypothetical protein
VSLYAVLAAAALALAALPVGLGLANLALYRPPRGRPPAGTAVSVLIPARDEAANIGPAVEAVLANRDLPLELIVLDDHSSDGTAAIVAAIAARDPRVRLEAAPPLPPGWSGKMHACASLAALARHELLLFIDADVRLAPDAVGRLAAALAGGEAGLVSGVPRQVTGSLGEALVVPLITLLLLGYLPLAQMRRRLDPGLGAACGQLIAVRREAYRAAGGHAAVRTTLHDGVKLPRAFRRAGLMTDLCDATDLASCRMFEGWRPLWRGLGRNAQEGMATPVALPFWTLLLAGGHVLPWLLLAAVPVAQPPGWAVAAAAAAALGTLALRLVFAQRFRQSLAGALLHPVGIVLLLAIQWAALLRVRRGRPSVWRGRSYSAS